MMLLQVSWPGSQMFMLVSLTPGAIKIHMQTLASGLAVSSTKKGLLDKPIVRKVTGHEASGQVRLQDVST